MRRWNGWGDDSIKYPLSSSALAFLEAQIGKSRPPQDCSLAELLKQLPKSRLPKHPLASTEPLTRLLHARGQSFPNWVALRSGVIGSFPDGVVYPQVEQDIPDLLKFAYKAGIQVIPYGGGTSVVGHIDPIKTRAPVLTIDMRRMNRLLSLDANNQLATFETGVSGPDLEAQLRAHGFTFGHFPQSFEYSTLGGWIATRSCGQQSLRYGRIEKLFAGGIVQTPVGQLEIPVFPASAAGPDLREFLLGSEGRMGIITQATVRISPLPEREDFHAVFFPDFQQGVAAVQHILAAGLSLSILRLSTAAETITTLALAGHENLIAALERLLALRGLGQSKCLLLLGFTGKQGMVKFSRKEALGITARYGGVHAGTTFGSQWQKNRFHTPYLRNTLWELGYGVDTLETSTDWKNTEKMIAALEAALQAAASKNNERVHIFTHLSHVYPTGCSVYTTYIFRLADDDDDNISRWQDMKSAASQAILTHHGTISHQHGVGTDHLPYLEVEKGRLGISAISALLQHFDPNGLMNPGKLIA